ncbi:Lipid A 3-O-deacylase (PagL) [Candidatus Methylomirabilis lanthanidiphila]|uniref:Lipid A 3-O-deacylase (PagL) n=1 Tax=Candidatus Methylomirabilis lanthanidiphila TaxID=2211376 RepID=A0A564ZG09_9BACT|nr:acyloxyacyl hydrolase [Candidatus Methylomirabilis lanthanidiphila]VUZ84066.1 Lipid A 3-O-deacylase (PagL) [Candidatus Methylomirabilis lanthanidiphila]
MINGLRRIPVCVWLAVFAILSPAISWAETSQQTIELGREAELIAIRTLAFAGPDGPPSSGEQRSRSTIRPEEGFQSGTWHLGVKAGGADTVKIFANRHPDIQLVPVFFQIGYTVTDVHGPFPVRGSLEVIFEPTLLFVAHPETEVGGGASLLFRYNFVTGTRWVPFFEVGVGILDVDLNAPRDLNSRFNFSILGGPGINYFLTDHLAVLGQVGLHHISNAHRKSPNVGVNSVMGLLGVSYYF